MYFTNPVFENIPLLAKPVLHYTIFGVAPREIMGEAAFKKIKAEVQARADHHCEICGRYVAHTMRTQDWIHTHEVYYLEFNEKLQTLSAEDFINEILKKLNVEKVFCGYDYRFGNKGIGTPQLIKDSGIEVDILEKKELNDGKISTTALKKAVQEGNFTEYYNLSNRHYSITGIVVKGRQLGRTINFPTANLKLEEKYLLPNTNGVYITKTKVKGKVYKSITNIGYNPTVSDGKDKKFIETHILDFDEDIYDEKIEVFFYEFLRKEQKFESFNHLKEQLQKDKKKCEEKDI